MAIIDLFAPDFPHGSQTGYERGCHGSAECGNYDSDELVTCREAQIARAGDYNLRKLPLEQALRRDQVWPPAVPTTPKPRPPLPTEPMPDVNVYDTPTKDDHDAAAHAVLLPAPVAPASGIDATATETRAKRVYQHRVPLDDPAFPHGTVKGRRWGCEDRENCPGGEGFTSCIDAMNAYSRDVAAKRRADHKLAVGPGKSTVAELLREVRATEGREFYEIDEPSAEQVATERGELLTDVVAAIDDLTQARNELAKAKELLTEISGAHAAVVLERDNVAGELALVRRANASLALSIHALEEEKAEWMAADTDTPVADEPTSGSFDVTAPPGVHVTVSIHVGSN